MFVELVKTYAQEISFALEGKLTVTEVWELIEQPKHGNQGDLAFPCFVLAKKLKKSPVVIAASVAVGINHAHFEKVTAEGPYINGFLNRAAVSKNVLLSILASQDEYGSNNEGAGKTITLDLSSPNIAKPFSMGHLRSTVIGNAMANIAEKCGYETIRINHLGDWGTQFGKLITAYQLWGSEEKVKQAPIQELLSLYVRFHDEAEAHPELNDEARLWFKKLEDQDEKAELLWKWFRDESLQEFDKIYQLLGISFDSVNGEAFYNDKMDEVVAMLEQKNLLVKSGGADVVLLDEYGLPPLLIRKSDGATLYGTRDLAAALYRQKNYQFEKSFYVVGQEQSLHFKQVFLVLQKLGFDWAHGMEHVPFGFILKDGKKMSTRKGKVVLLEQVIKEAVDMAENNIAERNPHLQDKEDIAQMVGIGAIMFHDLKNDRLNNVEFSLSDMLKFEGNTGPYVQYTHARACSILKKSTVEVDLETIKGLEDAYSWGVVKALMAFPDVIERSFKQSEPSHLAKYLLSLSQEFNSFYSQVKVLADDAEQQDRLALVKSVTITLNEGLRLLGIRAPERM